MATTRPFAYNPGPSISGTTQLGDLAIGDVPQDYSSGPGGVTWWMGPDEDLGYVIAVPVPDNTQPTNISGVTASVGFYGTEIMLNPFDESSFLTLVNTAFGQSFITGNDAKTWLNNEGYWTSYIGDPTELIMYLDSTSGLTGSNWSDLSGNGNNATLNGGYGTSTYNGYAVVTMNGSNSYALPTNGFGTQLDTGLTYDVWVYPTTSSNGTLIAEWGGTPPNGWNDAQMAFVNGTINGGLYPNTFSPSGYLTGPSFSPNTWYNIVMTYDDVSGDLKLYINGNLYSTTNGTKANPGSTYLSLGRSDIASSYLGGATGYFQGYIGIWKIWNGPISSTQILNNYNATLPRFILPTPTPTVTSTNTPTPTTTLTLTPTNTPTQTQSGTPNVTPTPTNTQTPTTTTTTTLTSTPTQTQSGTPNFTSTPTVTPTNTPTVTPTNPTLLQILNQTTGSRTITSFTLDGTTQPLSSGTYPITAGNNGYALTHGTNSNVNGVVFNFGGSGSFDLYSYLNGTLVNYLSSYNSSSYTMGGTILQTSDQLLLKITDPGALPTPTPSPTSTNTPTPTNTTTPTNTPNLQGFNYTNFASTVGLTAVGNAAVTSNIYYLTTANTSQSGNVYRSSAIQYNRNFSAQWEFIIGGGTGADGYCVQWTTTNNTTGSAGGGVSRITASSTINAISFTTFGANANNITWYKNGTSQNVQSYGSGFRQTLYYWLDYIHATSTANLYISTTSTKPGSPSFTYSSFTFDTTSYYMGFGAATGGSTDNHELVNWSLSFT